MATTCPTDLDTRRLRDEVSLLYARVASDPNGDFHFHRGLEYAVDFLGYDREELASLPSEATASFAGVGNPHRIGPISSGESVLDLGCGGGTDLLLSAHRTAPVGRTIGVDMTAAMLERAQAAAREAELPNVELRQGDIRSIPLPDAGVDVVTSNGVLNLTPDNVQAFSEIARVLRPAGRLLPADIVVEEELSEKIRRDIDLWTG